MASNETRAGQAVIKDAARVRVLLRSMAPDVLRALDKANRKSAQPILDQANRYVPEIPYPLYGWVHNGRTGWDATKIRKGFKFSAGKKRKGSDYRALLEFRNTSVIGAIFEQVGKTSRGQKRPDFVTKLNNAFPRKSRLIWRAVDEMGLEELRNNIAKNYEIARKQLQARIDSGGRV
jgi:hypothetical protein